MAGQKDVTSTSYGHRKGIEVEQMDRPSKLFTKNSPWAIVFCRGTMNSVTEEQSKLGCLVPGYFSGFSNMCEISLSSTV